MLSRTGTAPPNIADLQVSDVDNEGPLRLIPTVSSGYEAWGDDADETTTIVRAGETTPLVRLLHDEAWASRNVLGIERLEPMLSPELGCALVAAHCWKEQLTGNEVPYLFDIASGRAFHLFPSDIETHTAMAARTNRLRDAVTQQTGRTSRATLSPLRSLGGSQRYTLSVTLVGLASDGLRDDAGITAAQIAAAEVLEHDPDFEHVVIEDINVTFEPSL